MAWFQVDDRTAGQRVLIEASTSESAVAKYFTEYPPDLMVSKASPADIELWNTSVPETPWPL